MFERPPEHFRPLRASVDELHRYGFPHCPDPKAMPAAAQTWMRAMSRVRRIVVPEIQKVRGWIAGPQTVTNDIWSGIYLVDRPPYVGVWSSFTIPAVQNPPGQSDLLMAAWVGIGGVGNYDASLLQSGIVGRTFSGSPTDYKAFYCWYPGPIQELTSGFPVAPGQSIAVYVGSAAYLGLGGVGGICVLVNLTTGDAPPPYYVDIPTTDGDGEPLNPPIRGLPQNTAEWIVERPALTAGQEKITRPPLIDYGELNMTDAGAMSTAVLRKGQVVGPDEPYAVFMNMEDDSGSIVSEANITPAIHFTYQPTAGNDAHGIFPTDAP